MVRLGRPIRRVVSLVPSLTESIAVTAPGLLVGATDWCTHPPGLDVTRVRGTKNPDVAAIIALRPDLVVANKEENRRLDVERLRAAGVAVWVTDITSLDTALLSLDRVLMLALGLGRPEWLTRAREQWNRHADDDPLRIVIPVWRDPWMVVGPDTFTADLARRLGLTVLAPPGAERYPHTSVEQIRQLRPDVVVLPDEPYVFTATDGPEAFAGIPVALVSGRELTWYGPSLASARTHLTTAIRAAR